ncbi:sarcosine oxidase, putative [Talaromyces stipitatus ATCC 10500]|uniref:Sarcosine oxidase, putative n=1 Tax=Talaromyces stipitatus (strain ATCC 10500 / CBS 375.48 / QM 6759 / NRRL 1006) TaxID=441959 RepID=B8LZV1_TALSN|nr:sarcosine oxidase, putative [Talaromyces stipitatus ATCC 10500]EED20883.1 sarcosine oxidase, putative [Talaromyces stipitatus ATCC 10500]
MAASRPNTKIVVVGGGGTMGSSTALHLIRSGYTPSNITVLDVYPIPSAQSAGYDLNKIMSVRLRNKLDLQLSLEALDMWKNDELFKPFYHNVGMIDSSSSNEGIANLRRKYQSLVDAGVGLEKMNIWLESEDEILAKVPQFTKEQIKGWKGIFCADGGWLAAAKAINAIGEFLKKRGVKFGFGDVGTFKRPLFAADGTTCNGVETVDGTKYYADTVVLATGAWSPTLVDLENQCVSKAWVFAHIQLTPQEAAEYKDIPVVYDGEYGFFFEPNEYGVIKVCDEFPGFSHFKEHQPYGAPSPKLISVPRSHAKYPTDTYPDASEATIRKAIARFMPRFKNKELFNRSMCWCTDTADANLLICEHPRWKNFILATGDSGHTFKLLPSIGKHIVELIEGSLSQELAQEWRWRPGGDALKSRRSAPAKDLSEMPGWKHDAKL